MVEVRAHLWRRPAPSGCTDDGASELPQIDLDEPFGDRTLICGGQVDCRATVNLGEVPAGQVVAGTSTVAVAGRARLDIHDAAGELMAEVPGPGVR